MTYGWNTTRYGGAAGSFIWSVTRTEWNDDLGRARSVAVKTGICKTRAQAAGAAKRWCLFFRRGGTA